MPGGITDPAATNPVVTVGSELTNAESIQVSCPLETPVSVNMPLKMDAPLTVTTSPRLQFAELATVAVTVVTKNPTPFTTDEIAVEQEVVATAATGCSKSAACTVRAYWTGAWRKRSVC